MKISKLKSDERGSMVVEASIVFPIVIFVVFIVMYICYVMYLQTYVQAVTNEATEMASSSWENNFEFRETFKSRVSVEGIKDDGLYWRIYDPNEEVKCKVVEKYIYGKIVHSNRTLKEKRAYFEGEKAKEGISIKVKIKNYTLYKKVIVKVERNINTPFDEVKKLFGLKEGLLLKVESESMINEPTELIRNVDFATDIWKETKGDKGTKDIQSMMEKIQKFISDFL